MLEGKRRGDLIEGMEGKGGQRCSYKMYKITIGCLISMLLNPLYLGTSKYLSTRLAGKLFEFLKGVSAYN